MKRTRGAVVLMLVLGGCKPKDQEPPPMPEPVDSPPPPPATVAPITGGAPAPLPTAVATPTATATTRPTATQPGTAPPTPTLAALPIPFTPYRIPIPAVLPIPIPVGLPTALPTFPFPTASTPPPTPTSRPTASPPAASSERVIVFGTKWCGPCKSLQEDLRRRQVPFTFIDLEDPVAMKTPAGARAAEIPPDKRGGIPLTRVVLKSGAVDWVTGADGGRIERGYRG